jgi:hypothetical protein
MLRKQVDDVLTITMESCFNDSFVTNYGFSLRSTSPCIVLLTGGNRAPARASGSHQVFEGN